MNQLPASLKRVLIAEDDAVSLRLVEVFLKKWGYEPVIAADGLEALRLLEGENAPRIALLDWMMPGLEGIEICRRIRGKDERAYTYMVLLTARSHKQDRLDGLKAGADDYLTKPFDQDELHARLSVATRIVELQDELIRAREYMHYQATHDPLTGVANRREVLERLATELSRADRSQEKCSLALVDLDHFKTVNDTFGHLAGDDVLKETARRIQNSVRTYDVVGRYGGEEFLIVIPNCDLAGAMALAERVRKHASGPPVRTSTGEVPVSLSIGVAEWDPSEEIDSSALLRNADQALYRAKAKGRDRVEAIRPADISSVSPSSNARPRPQAHRN